MDITISSLEATLSPSFVRLLKKSLLHHIHFCILVCTYIYILLNLDNYLIGTNDFVNWSRSKYDPFIHPRANDTEIANFQDWPVQSKLRGSPPNAWVGVPEPYDRAPFDPYWSQNWTSWNWNSNDADSCCMHADVNVTHIIWGASTQGHPPNLPLTGTDAGANVIGVADMPLTQFFSACFD